MPKIAAFGGPYANPYALAAMLSDARARGCERIFCLGDLGGFGAEPDAIWAPLTEHGVECIAGNYDVAIGRGDPDCGCGYSDPRDNHFAQLIYDHTRAHTSPDFAAWMRDLPAEHRETLGGLDVHMVHGSPLATNDFMWESLPDDELRQRTRATGADVLLCTHTGIPWQREIDGTLVVNVGAVGRPANDGRTETWYAMLEIERGRARAELVPVAYDHAAQAASMRAAGLPEPFVETIETGWWTTCLEVVPPYERSRGRYQLYRDTMPSGFDEGGTGWGGRAGPAAELGGYPAETGGDPAAAVPNPAAVSASRAALPPALPAAEHARPVVPLFGSPAFPARLWIYSNFHCNLACSYCAVASSPTARRRSIGLERFRRLVDEAVAEGFEELYVTGGEPFAEPDIVAMLEYASERLPTVVLTNAMLFTGRRRKELERLAGNPRLVLQTSLDGARPETHDRFRGRGSWTKAMAGIGIGRTLGLPMRAAMTETDANAGEVDELRALLADIGIEGDDFAVRPLVSRGFAEDGSAGNAVDVTDAVMVPELTITADGAHWHPVGGDLASSPDLVVARGDVTLAEAKRRVVERFLRLRQEDGSLPEALQCAV